MITAENLVVRVGARQSAAFNAVLRAGITALVAVGRSANASEWQVVPNLGKVAASQPDITLGLLRTLAGKEPAVRGAVRYANGVGVRAPTTRVVARYVTLPDRVLVRELVAMLPGATETHLRQLGFEALLPKSTSSLSKVEARSLSLALAFTQKPEWLFLEEPLADLLPAMAAQIAHEFEAILARGGSVVMSTQSLDDARALASHVILVDDGQVQWHGPAHDPQLRYPRASARLVIHTDYVEKLVRALLDAPGMSSLHTTHNSVTLDHARAPEAFASITAILARDEFGIRSLAYESAAPEVLRANTLGDARAAYDAAYAARVAFIEAQGLTAEGSAQVQVAIEEPASKPPETSKSETPPKSNDTAGQA